MRSRLITTLFLSCSALCLQGATPVIINHTQSAGTGDIFYLQGGDFGSTPLVEYSYNDSNWKPLTTLGTGNGVITAKLPGSETQLPDLLSMRVSNDNLSWSVPAFINKPIATFFDTNQIAPGSNFQIFGDNLYVGRTPSVRFLDLSNGSSQFATVTVAGSTNYLLKAIAPARIQPGHKYQVYVSNGCHGNSQTAVESLAAETLTGRAAGPDYWQLGLPWAADFNFSANVYNTKSDQRLGRSFTVGDGNADDTWPINHAIQVAASAGGGVVYLPAGTYAIRFSNGCGIQLRPKVVLAGPGANEVNIKYGFNAGTRGGYAVCFSSQSGLADVTVNNVDTAQKWQWSGLSNGNSEVFMKRVTWNLGTSQWLNFQNDDHVAIEDSTIEQGLDSAFNNLGPLNMSSCSHCEVKGTNIKFITCGILFDRASDMVFQHNQVIRDISNSPDSSTVTHTIAANFVKNLAVTDNILSSVGNGVATNNDGEAIATEAGGAVRVDEFRGTVTSATASALTDLGQDFLQSANSIPALRPGMATVAIVSGNGLGQTRQVISVSPDGRTLGLDSPWDVQPEKGAHYATFDWSVDNWIIANNTLSKNFKGFEIFNASAENLLIQSNTLTDADGIMVSPAEYAAGVYGALFNVIKNLRIIGNTFNDTLGIHPAYVGLLPREDRQAEPFGTHFIGANVQSNNIIGFVPNVFNAPVSWDNYKVKTEGYLCSYYWQSNSPYDQATAPPPLLATVFQGNMSRNSKATFYLDSGAMHTVMADTYMKNASSALEDVPIMGASQASQGSITDSQLNVLPIGPVPTASNDLLQGMATNTGARAIAMGHEGTTPYTLENGGDVLNLLGQQVTTDSELVTRVTLTSGGTATALLMMRGLLTANSPFASIGLEAGSIVLSHRQVNAGSIQTTLIPYSGDSAVLKLIKSGSAITAMYSPDGIAWTPTKINVGFPARSYIVGVGEISDGRQTGPEVVFEGLTFEPVANSAANTGGSAALGSNRVGKTLRSLQTLVVVFWRAIRHGLAQII